MIEIANHGLSSNVEDESYFGEWVQCSGRTERGGNNEGLEEATELSCYELERVRRGLNCSNRTITIAKKWSIWCVVDYNSVLIVPVVRIDRERGMKMTFACQTCRTMGFNGSCIHKRSVTREVLRERGEDACMIDGNGDVYLTGTSESKEVRSEVRNVGDGERNDDNGARSSIFTFEAESGNRNRRRKKEKKDYVSNKMRYPLLPCKSNEAMMNRLTDVIETSVGKDDILKFEDPEQVECRHKVEGMECPGKKGKGKISVYNMSLFTASHREKSIAVVGWFCGACHKLNLYRGEHHGIFPTRKRSAYTVELLYCWVLMTCLQGLSFRGCYTATRIIQSTASYCRRFKTGRIPHSDGENKRSRRLANEAIRAFMMSIDAAENELTELLFRCKKWEFPLNAKDCEQLSLSNEMIGKGRRYKAVVIDGTSAGILQNLSNVKENKVSLSAGTRIRNKIVCNRQTQDAVKSFLRCLRRIVKNRLVKSKRYELLSDISVKEGDGLYFIEDGTVYVNVKVMLHDERNKRNKKKAIIERYLSIIIWYICKEGCI